MEALEALAGSRTPFIIGVRHHAPSLSARIEAMLDDVKGIISELESFAQFITGTTPQISGILEEGQWLHPEEGSPQGAVISPLLSNIYLHEVLEGYRAMSANSRTVNGGIVPLAWGT